MWLLNTKTAILHKFDRPENVPGGYAILSHVWGKDEEEDTFQATRDAAKQCKDIATRRRKFSSVISAPLSILAQPQKPIREQGGTISGGSQDSSAKDSNTAATRTLATPRDSMSPKIRNFLIQAEKEGYEWAWSDTCCIDRTSSAELTEAINSMFQYYSLSDVCYAYLVDVPPDTSPDSDIFRNSQWHERGWTLQELLAPRIVVFMSNGWTPLGSKYTLANVLEDVTEIPSNVLRLEQDFTAENVATRMSWAAKRRTTRVEDGAYCLLGIFGVNMSTLYGEGQNAFYRLQEEITKNLADTTLLVWGTDPSDAVLVENMSTLESMATKPGVRPLQHAYAPSPKHFSRFGGGDNQPCYRDSAHDEVFTPIFT